MAAGLVGVDEVAKFCNVTPRRVQQLVAEGMPQYGRGKYHLTQAVQWYIRYLQDKAGGRPSNTDEIKAARTRLTAAQAEMAELDAALKRGEVAPVEDFQLAINSLLALVVMSLKRLPGISNELAAISEPAIVRKRLREEIAEIQNTAAAEIVQLAADWERGKARGIDSGVAAGSERRQVGGRKSDPSTRKRSSGKVEN